MLVPDKMKLNNFKQVNIPRNKMLFNPALRIDSSSMYSGEEILPISESKVDTLVDMIEYDKMKQAEVESNNEK